MHSQSTELTPAQQVAAQLPADLLTRTSAYTVDTDVMSTAAAYIRQNWGHYGYSMAVERAGFSWTLFRGHHSDGSDFYFIVDRWCNVADVAVA